MDDDSIDMEDDCIDMEDDSIDMGYLVTLSTSPCLVEDLVDLDEDCIASLHLKKLHRVHFLEVGRCRLTL
jgi:hypothetical protein